MAQVQARTSGPEQVKPAFQFHHPVGHVAFLTTTGPPLGISYLGLQSTTAMALCCLLLDKPTCMASMHAVSSLAGQRTDQVGHLPRTSHTRHESLALLTDTQRLSTNGSGCFHALYMTLRLATLEPPSPSYYA